MESRRAEVAGIPLRWEEHGEGEPVVFLHGLPTSPRLWRHVLPQVRARCLAWELVGYGQSMPLAFAHEIGLARQAEYLANWLGHLNLERVVLVGHDLGGGIAQLLALQDPRRVRALVLTNSVAYDAWPIPALKRLRRLASLLPRLPEALVRSRFRRLLARGYASPAAAEAGFKNYWPPYHGAGAGAGAVLARQLQALDPRETAATGPQLRRLHRPARLIWGAADRYQRIQLGYRLANDLGAPIDRIDSGRHFVPEEHPDRLAAGINRLLQGLAAG